MIGELIAELRAAAYGHPLDLRLSALSEEVDSLESRAREIERQANNCLNLEQKIEDMKSRAALAQSDRVPDGWQLVPAELIEHVKHARKLLGGNSAPEWQREKLRQKLTDLLAAAPSAGSQKEKGE